MKRVLTLADFKRYLTTPGATVRLVSVNGHPAALAVSGWRTVAKLQTNAVAFNSATVSGKSWLEFGKASDWRFSGNRAEYNGLIYELGEN